MKRTLQNFSELLHRSGTPGIKNSLAVFLLLFGVLTASAQWSTQSPKPTYLDVRGVGAPGTDRVFIATDDNSFDNGGALFESNDGGTTWVQRDVPESLADPLNGIFFYDSLSGWVYGNDNYRTTDGGTTWTQLPFLGSTYFMEFYSPTLGITTGNFGQYISYDGGLNWVESPNGIGGLDMIDDTTGLGLSDTAIFRTTDGATSFTLVYSGDVQAIRYLTSQVALGIVNDTIIRSTDGGLTWVAIDSAGGRKHLERVSDNVVLAWGRAGIYPDYDDRLFRSSDGGQTWNDLGEVMPEGVYAIRAVDAQSVVVADLAGNMFHSADAGLTWTLTFVSRGQQPGFLSSAMPVFPDGQTGYFGYGSGFVIKSTNAGATWFQVSSGTGESLNDIGRFAGGSMIAVGDAGTLLTSDGSSPWIINEPFTTLNLVAVDIVSSTGAVVADEEGRIYTTNDGGNSWTASDSVPAGFFEASDLSFSTLLDGWVIGMGYDTAALYHTTDGGQTWIPVSELLGAYTAVDVVGSHIWAANVSGGYYRSTDGGNTWIQGELPISPVQVFDMDFYNESTGYAVSWWGYVFRSDDGGITWQELPIQGGSPSFTGISLLGPNELWLSTNDDMAYYSANGGQNWAILEIGSSGFGNFSAITASPAGDAWTVGFQGYIEHFQGPPPPPLNQPPVAAFDFSAFGLTVEFTDASTDPDGTVVSWNWDFGDGWTSTAQNPIHTFDTANTYIVYLTVFDDDGDSSLTGQIVVVQPGPGGTYGDFTEVTPIDSVFVTPQDEDFWVITTAPADYDNDGDIDIAVLGYYVVYYQSVEDRLIIMENNGLAGPDQWDFTYHYVPLGDLTSGASDMAWGDLDGDNDLDLAIGTDDQTVIFRNDSSNMVLMNTNLPGYWEDNDQAYFDLQSITWADYDNDGDLDLLIPSAFNDSTWSFFTALMRNDGPDGSSGWNFTMFDSIFTITEHAQSSWADFDGDQDLDLLLVNHAPIYDEGFIKRYRNDGNNTFTEEDILGTLSVEHGEVQWGDYDGDGDLDILVAGNVKELDSTYTPMVLRIYQNDSNTFIPFDVIACIPCEGWFDLTAATWADYDSDGDMDILLAGTYNSGSQIEGRAMIYVNDSSVFTASANELPAPRASGSMGGTFSWFDIDNDGDLDYFIAGQYFVPGGNGLVEAQMHLYRNDVPAQNDAPSIPTGLDVTVQENGTVMFSWNPSTDDHTPSAALTYDLEIYFDGTPVYNSSRLPQPGNVSAVNQWILSGLQDGTYDWSLRAVDAAYVGSPLASGQFYVGIPTAVISNDDPGKAPALAQNYPNPFHASTTISYTLAQDGPVSLKIYNINGVEVDAPLNAFQVAGDYSITYGNEQLPDGVYFYSLRGNNFIETRMMVLVR